MANVYQGQLNAAGMRVVAWYLPGLTDVQLDDLIITGGSAMAGEDVIKQTDIDGMETYAGKEGDTSSQVQTVVALSSKVAGLR